MAPADGVTAGRFRDAREPSLLDYLRALWRHKLIVLVTVVVAVAAVIGLDMKRQKVYAGSAQLLFTEQGANVAITSADLTPTAIATDMQLVESSPVKALAAKLLGAPAPPASVSEVGTTDVAQITVDSSNPSFAARAANAYASAYIRTTTTGFVHGQLASERQIQAQITSVKAQITKLDASSSSSGLSPLQVQARLTDLNGELSSLQLQLVQTQLATAQSPSGGQLVVPAVPNLAPVSPKRAEDAVIGGVIGLLVGVAFALLRDFLDDQIRGPDDLDMASNGLPSLGIIPEVGRWRNRKKPYLVTAREPRSAATEAYRAVRTSIQFMSLEDPVRTLLVTSPGEGGGKTTTATNLALAMAEGGQRVALVDCDLRGARLHDFFEIPNRDGLSSVLLGEISLDDALVTLPAHDRLIILPAGRIPPNPTDLLSGSAITQVLDALAQRSDMVVLDSSPVLTGADAAALGARVDGVLLVAPAGAARRRDVRRALESLRRVGANVLGTVLNRAPSSGPYAYSRVGLQYGYRYRPTHARQT